MDKIYYELGGTEFSEKAKRWFAVLNKVAGSSARYYETNSDQWGRPFGHKGYIVADNDDDITTGLKILESSGRFERIPGTPINLATWIYRNPSRVFRLDRAEKIAEMASKVQKYLHLSDRQWFTLANEGDLFIGEQVFADQEEDLNGPSKAILYIRMYSKEVKLFMIRWDEQGYAEEPAHRWGII